MHLDCWVFHCSRYLAAQKCPFYHFYYKFTLQWTTHIIFPVTIYEHECNTGTRSMTQWVKHLTCQCEDLSFSIQNPCRQAVEAHVWNPSVLIERLQVETGESHTLPGLLLLQDQTRDSVSSIQTYMCTDTVSSPPWYSYFFLNWK